MEQDANVVAIIKEKFCMCIIRIETGIIMILKTWSSFAQIAIMRNTT